MTQQEALIILKTGANVFLTGEPGSGKTHTVNQYVDYLRRRGVEPAITASTGIAATHLGGVTIHSWSGIGIKTKLDKRDLGRIILNEHIEKRVRRTKVLIIDEVSMLSSGTLSMVDVVCRKIKQNAEAFGGMQIVLVGDFFQLPPVVKSATEGGAQAAFILDSSIGFAYGAPSWMRANPTVCYLTEQHRQDDNNFLSILSSIRLNIFSKSHLRSLETRRITPSAAPDGVPKLFPLNADVDSINNKMLGKIFGKPQVFLMSSEGPGAQVAALQKGCLSPETLYLKIGAAVMFTKNNLKERFVNGTLGAVSGFDKESGQPIITTRDGRRIKVSPMDWTVEENGKIRARITQLPLRLAWAITVHKSQGMSLDEAVMDLSDVFEFGQGYVALSRVRKLSGIFLLGWNERTFLVHPDVLVKDGEFRVLSKKAGEIFSKVPARDIREMHNNFVRACGGKNLSECMASDNISSDDKIGDGISFEKIREKHSNAYRPWDKTQDDKLREFFMKGLSVAELIKIFGRKKGAIGSRLVKLGLTKKLSVKFKD
ncbi:AAA family ATPase [Patescibacteria group bacterium]|nr:AAA family ATPase [Patescibacteria group bacterium]